MTRGTRPSVTPHEREYILLSGALQAVTGVRSQSSLRKRAGHSVNFGMFGGIGDKRIHGHLSAIPLQHSQQNSQHPARGRAAAGTRRKRRRRATPARVGPAGAPQVRDRARPIGACRQSNVLRAFVGSGGQIHDIKNPTARGSERRGRHPQPLTHEAADSNPPLRARGTRLDV